MWRAKLGEKNHLNSVQYGVNPIEPSPPGWTLTPLFQEVQFVKETCARIALENAALVAQNGKLKAEMAELRERQAINRDREVLLCYYSRHDRAKANPSKIMRMLTTKAKQGLATLGVAR